MYIVVDLFILFLLCPPPPLPPVVCTAAQKRKWRFQKGWGREHLSLCSLPPARDPLETRLLPPI